MNDIDERSQTIVIPENGQATNSAPSSSAPTNNGMIAEVNLRIPLNIAIPALAILGIAITVGLAALLLLNLPHEYAPAVALALAVNIMAAATFAASRKTLGWRTVVELGALVVYPVLLAVVLVNLGGFGHIEEGSAETAPAAAEAPAPVAAEAAAATIGAENMQFTSDELAFPAGQDVALTFDNPDVAPHNVSIYGDDSLEEELFIGENVDAGASTTYQIPALEAGAYFFRCDVHPTMTGRVTVE